MALLQAAHGQIHPQAGTGLAPGGSTTTSLDPAPLVLVDVSDTGLPVRWARPGVIASGPLRGLDAAHTHASGVDAADEQTYERWIEALDPAPEPLVFATEGGGNQVRLVPSSTDAVVLATGFDGKGGVVVGRREVPVDSGVQEWKERQQGQGPGQGQAPAGQNEGADRDEDDRDDEEQLEDDDDAMASPGPAVATPQPPPGPVSGPGTAGPPAGGAGASPTPRPLAPQGYVKPNEYVPPEEAPLLTMFTTMFSSKKHSSHAQQKNQIQRNTLLAARHLFPTVEMIVFSEDEGTREMCAQEGVFATGDFERNPHGTPFLKSMYQWVERHTRARMYGYMNADILFGSDLIESIRAVLRAVDKGHLHERVLVVGRRTNFAMPFPLNADSEWMFNDRQTSDYKIKMMAVRGRLFQKDAQDFFFVTRGALHWDRIPNFVIGRIAYDNWLVDHAFHDGLDRVEITDTAHAVHQTGIDGDKAGFTPRPDKDWNKNLGKGNYDHGLTSHCNFHTEWGVDPRTGHKDRVKVIRRPKWHPSTRKKARAIPADKHLEAEQPQR